MHVKCRELTAHLMCPYARISLIWELLYYRTTTVREESGCPVLKSYERSDEMNAGREGIPL